VQIDRAVVDAELARAAGSTEPETEKAVLQDRLRTLFPIFRNGPFALIAMLIDLTILEGLQLIDRPGVAPRNLRFAFKVHST
jgi:hypothetical protein